MQQFQIHAKILGGLVLFATVIGLATAPLSLSACNGTNAVGVVDTSQILVTEPRGGESYKVGDSIHIQWKLQGEGLQNVASVSLSLSPNNGKDWALILNKSIGLNDANWGNFAWAIKDSINISGLGMVNLVNNRECLIQVKEYTHSEPKFITKPFTIIKSP
jgi:hypothetical protein